MFSCAGALTSFGLRDVHLASREEAWLVRCWLCKLDNLGFNLQHSCKQLAMVV